MFDLRSDTVTQPTPAMREAMATAEVGDDVYGDDPTVARLEARAAELLGKPAALFVPSGTMGNQVALGCHARSGQEVIGEATCHVLMHEVGSAARLWGVTVRTVEGERGVMDPAAVAALIREPPDIHWPSTAAILLENTHNGAGGVVLPLEHVDAITALAREHGLAVHVDGARLFNAAVASGTPAARLVRDVDTVSVCLSKGLGAPVGSVVAGGVDHIARCRKLRKALGGGMRQAGVIAAAALIALDEGPKAMVDDHRRARQLAEALVELPGADVDLDRVQTNMVMVGVAGDVEEAVAAFAAAGVRCIAYDHRRLRFTFHRDVGDDALQAAVTAARSLLG